MVALVAVMGCRRADRTGSGRSGAGELGADEGRTRRPDPQLRPAGAAPAPGMAAPGMAAPGMAAPGMAAPGMTAPPMATPPMATPPMAAPLMAAPPVKDPKGQPNTLRPRQPAPFVLIKAGAQPRLTLRYRFSHGEKLVWLDLTTTVTRAADGLYQLDTRLSNVTMTLPPALANQRELLLKVLGNLSYTRRMSSRGRVTRFAFGKLTPRALLNLSKRFEAPLSHLQPMLPTAPVGVGAVWQHRRQHPLQQPGGRIDAIYLTQYKLTAFRTDGGRRVVDLKMATEVKMTGKLMGNDFSGGGTGTASLTLDAVRGVILRSKGNLWICSAVKGRTSTNRTAFSQTFGPDHK
jgi:hypothetical protein